MSTQSSGTGGELDAADRNALSDRQFAFPAQRKEPLSDAAHVRNAIARFDQVQDVTDRERDEAFTRIQHAAKRFDVELAETSWRELGKTKTRSRDALYEEAKRKNIKGRSTMTRAELEQALAH